MGSAGYQTREYRLPSPRSDRQPAVTDENSVHVPRAWVCSEQPRKSRAGPAVPPIMSVEPHCSSTHNEPRAASPARWDKGDMEGVPDPDCSPHSIFEGADAAHLLSGAMSAGALLVAEFARTGQSGIRTLRRRSHQSVPHARN